MSSLKYSKMITPSATKGLIMLPRQVRGSAKPHKKAETLSLQLLKK